MSELSESARLLYCHCQYAQVIPKDVKSAVLEGLSSSGAAFEAVADLCEMAARHDPALKRLSTCGPVKIAACFPRAVKGLFHQAAADLDPTSSEVINMPPSQLLKSSRAYSLRISMPIYPFVLRPQHPLNPNGSP